MTANDVLPRFEVRCIKEDGVRRVLFKAYDDRRQAEIDLAGLRRVGIQAELIDLSAPTPASNETLLGDLQ